VKAVAWATLTFELATPERDPISSRVWPAGPPDGEDRRRVAGEVATGGEVRRSAPLTPPVSALRIRSASTDRIDRAGLNIDVAGKGIGGGAADDDSAGCRFASKPAGATEDTVEVRP